MSDNEFSTNDYYSLLQLLEKLGKDGVAELVAKGKPRRVSHGDMIYFYKMDVNRILGEELLAESDKIGLIVDDEVGEPLSIASQLEFTQTLVQRLKVGQERKLYSDKVLDLSKPVHYGRSEGDPDSAVALKACGIISSLHGKLYLDEDDNLLYENIGANKSKIRGPREDRYTVLEQDEIGVLISADMLQELLEHPHALSASIKLGFQVKPHFIFRIQVKNKQPV